MPRRTDEQMRALLLALILRAWNPALHPRDAHGRFRRVTGADLLDGVDVGDVSDRQLLRLFGDMSAEDEPNVEALQRVFDEMSRREEAKRLRHNPIRRLKLENRSEDELYRLWNQHADSPAAVASIQAELDRRRAVEQAERDKPLVSWDVHGQDTVEQRQIDKLVASGRSYREAYAEAYGLSDAQLAAQERMSLVDIERRAGETRQAAVRRAYGEFVQLQYLEAEQATRGHLLSPAGRAAGIEPLTLFSGPSSRARKYASEDLLRFWADRRRVTYAEFAHEVFTGAPDEEGRIRGNDRDFGV